MTLYSRGIYSTYGYLANLEKKEIMGDLSPTWAHQNNLFHLRSQTQFCSHESK